MKKGKSESNPKTNMKGGGKSAGTNPKLSVIVSKPKMPVAPDAMKSKKSQKRCK
jgi:hypothetical protein